MIPTYITATTLVDITNTGCVRVSESNKKEYHQQQNFNVLLQTIGLRTQLFDHTVSILCNKSLENTEFGEIFKSDTATVWELSFYVENPMVWYDESDPIYFLKQDAHRVAITSDLDNSVDFLVNMFDTKDNINLYFAIN